MVNAHSTVPNSLLSSGTIRETLTLGLASKFAGQNVLILIPDHTRSLPLPLLFRTLVEILHDAKQLAFMVALGTHPPLNEASLNQLLDISPVERSTLYKDVVIKNHAWQDESSMITLGVMEQDEIRAIAGDHWHSSLPSQVRIQLNKAVMEYDHIVILGPTFPHEVAGFSGGAKYLFPGISGAEMINATHWLGALAGVVGTIGMKDTPVRSMIHAAAARLTKPVTLVGLVVVGDGLAGVFIGDLVKAWNSAADLSAQYHIRWVDKPYQRVLSCAPPMYDELWTAAKAMYKLEPAIAKGGEVVIYAPHLGTVSQAHGEYIYQVGYHILPYFLDNWERYRRIPLGVLAHSTHLRGGGVMDAGIERPNVRVTLASKISPEDCARLNLSYLNPSEINPEEWKGRESEGILLVPHAGELLYRLKNSAMV